MSKAAKKKAKRKEKKKQQSSSEETVSHVTQSLAKIRVSSCQSVEPSVGLDQSESAKHASSQSEEGGRTRGEVIKKIRNMRKKLKQIQQLEKRIQTGELKDPKKEQLQKISKKDAILAEIKDLEIDLKDL